MRCLIAILVVVALISPPAFAYKAEVHRRITQRAIDESSLNTRLKDYGISLGLLATNSRMRGECQEAVFTKARVSSVREWIECGAVAEDSPVIRLRVFRHFFNPLTGEGLYGFPPSTQWGLELPANSYNLSNAKAFLYKGVVGATEEERVKNLRLAFQSIGHVVHLIEDLGQPEHTRLDAHPPWSSVHFYEKFAEAQLTGSYEGFSCPLSFGGYPVVSMRSPNEYWSRPDQKGLADYSANGFVTPDTNFSGRRQGNTVVLKAAPGFPLPNDVGMVLEKKQITELLGPTGPNQPLVGEVWFIKTPVTDHNDGQPPPMTRTSTFSIFDEDLASKGGDWVFTLNRFNYCDIQKLLLPRAVGYSAGLINYFFRGKLEISPPDRGAYAYVDHSYPQSGFWSITAKVKNATPNEVMAGGQLVAAVKFHRNHCYQPDLSGEFVTNEPVPCSNYRSKEEEMVLSKPLTGIRLESLQEKEFTFELQAPLPMNATDVYVQVVYSGALGSEVEGLAVGARDLSEPTFVSLINTTDRYQLPTSSGYQFFLSEEIKQNIKTAPYSIADINRNGLYDPPGDYSVDGGDLSVRVFLKGAKAFNQIAFIPALPKGRFSRLALLVDPQPFKLQVATYGLGFNGIPYEYDVSAKYAQLDYTACTGDRCTYRVGSVHRFRKTYHWWSLALYHGHPPRYSGFDDMPVSTQPEASVPVPVELSPFPLLEEPRALSLAGEPADNVGISVSEAPGASREVLLQLPK